MPRGWWGLGWERSRPLPDDGVLVCVELLALPATVMLLGKNLSVDSDADEGWFLQHTECREDILLWKLKPLTSIHRGLRVCPENYSGRVQYKLQPAGRSCKCSSFKSMIVTYFFSGKTTKSCDQFLNMAIKNHPPRIQGIYSIKHYCLLLNLLKYSYLL